MHQNECERLEEGKKEKKIFMLASKTITIRPNDHLQTKQSHALSSSRGTFAEHQF